MPYKDLKTLMKKLGGTGRELRDATLAIKKARVIKTDQEASQVAAACQAQSDAYDQVPGIIKPGDIMVLDTGLTVGGYYCDFNRNFAVGAPADDEVKAAYDQLYAGTDAAIAFAAPGRTMGELFEVMVE